MIPKTMTIEETKKLQAENLRKALGLTEEEWEKWEKKQIDFNMRSGRHCHGLRLRKEDAQ